MAWARAAPVLKRKLQRPPSREFAQISRAERLKFTQKSAHDTPFTGAASQNANLETNPQISDWICQKVPAEMVKTNQFCCCHKVQKATHPTPGVLVTELPISHPLQTVGPLWLVIKSKLSIRPSLAQEKIAKGTLDCKLSLKQVTYSNYSQTLKLAPPPPQPCTFDTELRVTHPLLELPLGCLEKQALTASPCRSENFTSHLLANSLLNVYLP